MIRRGKQQQQQRQMMRKSISSSSKRMQTRCNKFAGPSFSFVTQAIIIITSIIIVLLLLPPPSAIQAATANEDGPTLAAEAAAAAATVWPPPPGQRNSFPGENLSPGNSISYDGRQPLIGPPPLVRRQTTATRLPDEHRRPAASGATGRRFPAISRLGELLVSLGPRLSSSSSSPTPSSGAGSSQESRNLASFVAEPSPIEVAPAAAASKGPPIYRSAPKQIIEVHEAQPRPQPMPQGAANKKPKASKSIAAAAVPKAKKSASSERRRQAEPIERPPIQLNPADLNSAAGYHHDQHHQHQSARKETQMKTKKRKKHAYPPQYTYFGKYHEHRSVPAKGAWEFGYKRGNAKHTIEREEHGHKSHFKTEVKWKDKKGKGHHVFDYNHGDHKKRANAAAAAAASVTQQRKSQPTGGRNTP